jgi:cell wall-associated NlpC family hydrolase
MGTPRNMQATGERIAEAAMAMVGTPFTHRGRNPRTGVDCAGHVLCSHWAAGREVPDAIGYGPLPRVEVLMAGLESRARRVHMDDAEAGDVLLFTTANRRPIHFGIMVGAETFTHAHQSTGCVVLSRLSRAWRSLLHSIWRIHESPRTGEET